MTQILFERKWEVTISEVADPYLNQKVSEGNLPIIDGRENSEEKKDAY